MLLKIQCSPNQKPCNMKFFAAVVLVAIVAAAQALTDEQKTKLHGHKEACFKETGADVEEVKKTKTGVFGDDPKVKEFLFCLGKKIGLINEAGEYQLDRIREKVGPEIGADEVEKVIAACTAKSYGSGAENSYQLSKCYFEQKQASIV